VRYGVLLQLQERLVERKVNTLVTLPISKKGQRILFAPKRQAQFRDVFGSELRPLSGRASSLGESVRRAHPGNAEFPKHLDHHSLHHDRLQLPAQTHTPVGIAPPLQTPLENTFR
jgi:hypothetical protein